MLPEIDNPHLENIYIRSIMRHLKQDKKDILRKIEEQQALTDKNPSTSSYIKSLEVQNVDAKQLWLCVKMFRMAMDLFAQ